ncbi:MAG: hypothetical protein IJY08_05225 [Clostridia bacterium]|nr:hypothetical protein [Clostridia bacterium]
MKKILVMLITLAMLLSVCALFVFADDTVPAIPAGKYGVKQGSAAIVLKTTVDTKTVAASKTAAIRCELSQTYDISSKEYILFWVYCSDVNNDHAGNQGDQLEIRSSSNEDAESYLPKYGTGNDNHKTNLTDSYGAMVSGWNQYLVKVSDLLITKNDGCDMKAVKLVGMVQRTSANGGATYALGPVYAVNTEDITEDAGEITPPVIDTAAPPAATEPTTPPEAAELPAIPAGDYAVKEGGSAIKMTTGIAQNTSTGTGNCAFRPTMADEKFDITGKKYLLVWIYVSDAEKNNNSNQGDSLELTSGGASDVNESALNFYMHKTLIVPTLEANYRKLETGWNQYLLKLDDFVLNMDENKTLTNGGVGCDFSAVNYIRMVVRAKEAGVTYGLGEIYAVNIEDLTYDTSDPTLDPDYQAPEDTLGFDDPGLDLPGNLGNNTTEASGNTTAEQTTAGGNSTETAAGTDDGGCGSSVAFIGVASVAAVGVCAAVVSRKKKQD